MDDSWKLYEEGNPGEKLANRESLFSLGNGYIGFRGFYTERRPAYHPGVFVNGFYELTPIQYGEPAYGLAEFNQTMLDLPDCRYMEIRLGDELVDMSTGEVEHFSRILDFRTGILTRTLRWKSPKGIRAAVTWMTLLSFTHSHMGALKVSIDVETGIPVTLRSTIALPAERPRDEYDPRVSTKLMRPPLEQIDSKVFKREHCFCITGSFRTIESNLHLICGLTHRWDKAQEGVIEENQYSVPYVVFTSCDGPFAFYKFFCYHTSRISGEEIPQESLEATQEAAFTLGWEGLVKEQREYLDTFWQTADVEVHGDPLLQKALRFNLFQLLQSAGRDGRTSLAAKGLTGGGYEGHYFWDTEIYGMPFFTYTMPQTARALIQYRISILQRARERARMLSQKGALFPWRTINGLEASAYYPAGTAQYHINADIAYSIFQYLDTTGDISILQEGAAEVLFETARLWTDLGFENPRKNGAFCINEVTGPDEYSALVNNNCYTNVMARYHLRRSAETARTLASDIPDYWRDLCSRIDLLPDEIDGWQRAADRMFIPFDRELGIHPQDDTFLDREPWRFSTRPKDAYPLLLHYHPLVIYRYRVLKQADAVLAMLLLPDEFPWYQKKRDFDFYEPLTTGDSSLSACIQGILAFEYGYVGLGMEYCRDTALMDIEDLHSNTKDGLHTAAMAGSWMAMVYGIAGFRLKYGTPFFRPIIPPGWTGYRFRLRFGQALMEVSADTELVTYTLVSGNSLKIRHRSELLDVTAEGCQVPVRPSFKGAVFDLDGVLTSTDEHHYLAWKHIADAQGWEFTRELNMQLRGVSRRESLMIIARHNQAELEEEVIRSLMEQKNTFYRSSLEQLTEAHVFPGVRPLLTELKDAGIRLAIASASRNAPYILEKLKLSAFFDYISPAHEVVRGKPDPEVFARAAEGLALLPEECVGIEDAPAGIQGIKAAMMQSVGVGPAVAGCSCGLYVENPDKLTYKAMEALFTE